MSISEPEELLPWYGKDLHHQGMLVWRVGHELCIQDSSMIRRKDAVADNDAQRPTNITVLKYHRELVDARRTRAWWTAVGSSSFLVCGICTRMAHRTIAPRGATFFSCIVDGPSPVWADSIVAANEAQGREIVDQQQRGADFIKVYDRLPRDVYFAIADEAHKRGIPFEGHVPESVTVAEASDAGQEEHRALNFRGRSLFKRGGADSCRAAKRK